jgi:hypothetical protein
MSSVNVGVGVNAGMRFGLSKYFLSFAAVGFALPFYLLLLSGFPTIDAVRVCSMIFVQIVAGAIIWMHASGSQDLDVIEGVGFGLAIGSIFTVIGHQLFLPTSFKSFGWLLPVLVALVIALFSSSGRTLRKSLVLNDFSSTIFVAFSTVLTLKQWWWLLPLALPTSLALFVLSETGRNTLTKFVKPTWAMVAVLFLVATFVMVFLRQLNFDWWIRSWDVVYHESKSFSIANFGPNENISLIDYPMNYHWFGNAWIGTNSLVSELPPWLSIAQVAPVYSAIATGCLIIKICFLIEESVNFAIISLIVFAFGTGGVSPANPPNVVAMIWSFAGLAVLIIYQKNKSNRVFIVFSLLGLAAFSGKVSAGFILISGFFILEFFNAIQGRRELFKTTLRCAGLIAFTFCSYFFIIGGPSRLGNNTFKLSYKGPGITFGVDPDRNPIIFLLGAIGTSITLVSLILTMVLVLIFKLSNTQVLLTILTVCISAFVPFYFLVDDGMIYFLSNSLNLASIGSGVALVTIFGFLLKEKQITQSKIYLLILFAALSGTVIDFLMDINWRETIIYRGGPTPILLLIQLFAWFIYWIATKFFVISSSSDKSKSRIKNRVLMFSCISLIALVAPRFINNFSSIERQALRDYSSSRFTGSTEVNLASDWLRDRSNPDDVLATNKFCISKAAVTCIDPKYFGVSSTTQRQMLIEGPYYVVSGPHFSSQPNVSDETKYPGWVKERLDLSRGFADKPNAEIKAKLREYGVDWFYLFKENTTNRNWEPYGTVMYENTEVAIIKLNEE